MTELLLIFGAICAVCIFFFIVYGLVSHPADVDEEMTAAVEHETLQQHAHALGREHQKTKEEESKENEEMYGPGQ